MQRLFQVSPVLWALLAIFSSNQAMAADSDELAAVKQQFVGHYELVSFVSFRENGDVVDNNYVGRIMYDDNDEMSAQGMPKDLPERAAQSSERISGGFAYWGSVSWDIANGIVTHHVTGSPTRGSWVGEDNVRYYEFTDVGLLKLSMKDEDGRLIGTLTWRRIESN
ncbi:lipocalin-like domain-containing protein [Pseudohongiella nitratireducens]|uniref:lipocalin-like domain-containing protein n=1 Tax=Pseudohongiella nitratireducens TaxID=1768907 RepID=UPI0030EC393C|tara:strand:+ start:6081 stop:6578 length:498 start_codon:yes stop_codon:yes gene_type:complete